MIKINEPKKNNENLGNNHNGIKYCSSSVNIHQEGIVSFISTRCFNTSFK